MEHLLYTEQCHLLRLAPELRLLIYEHLWDGLQPAEVHIKSDNSGQYNIGTSFNHKREFAPLSRWPRNRAPINRRTYALLRTCKLIAREANPVAWEKTHFDILMPAGEDALSLVPVWRDRHDVDVLRRAVSASVQLGLFTTTTESRKIYPQLLLSQLEDLDRRLPQQWIRRTLFFCVAEGATLTEENRRTYAAMQWRGDIVIKVHRRIYAELMNHPVYAAWLTDLLRTRPWYANAIVN